MIQRTLLALACSLLAALLHAQFAPNYNGLNYQAVIRDAAGNPVPNQAISLRVRVNPGLALGYSETHSVITDANGLINILIGQGTPEPGSVIPIFDDVDFTNGSLWSYVVDVDLAGGTNWTSIGGGPFKALPFAHFARASKKPWDYDAFNGYTFTSDNNNVGIGTNAPVDRFTVRQNGIGISQENGDGTIRVGFYSDATFGAYVQTHSNHPLKFSTNNGNTHMTIATNGFVGIGTEVPTARLHVNGSVRVGAYTLPSTDGTSGQVLSTNGAGTLSWSKPWATAPTWVPMSPLQNGHTSTGGLSYTKGPDNVVRFRGAIQNGVNGTIAFTLPAGNRPGTNMSFVGTSNTSVFHRVVIFYATGNVVIEWTGGVPGLVNLDGISFIAEN